MKLLQTVLLLISFNLVACTLAEKETGEISIYYTSESPVITYGMERLSDHLNTRKQRLKVLHEGELPEKGIFVLSAEPKSNDELKKVWATHRINIRPEGYKLIKVKDRVYIIATTENGGLYGIMDLMEQWDDNADIDQVKERHVNPALSFRAIKFNLPWSPYRPGPATDLHTETCRDLKFWEAYLDMMVDNRFNALSLWNTHPFPYMIRAKNYPEATPLSDGELEEWQAFWKSLFKMAKDRGIETYLVNWNIVVSPAFADAYGAKEYFDRSDLVKNYTKESVTQLINTYEDLTGLGVTLADWMGNWGEEKMLPAEREEWIKDTFVEGMKAADRKVKFIHRAVLAGDPQEMRQVIDHADLPDKTIVEVKFNWSHGHSTPRLSITHANDAGTIMRGFWDPAPENYFIAWMIRNEDFFVLRWGDPQFIREHISTNNLSYVDGYFVGSEGYIPAVDYSHADTPEKTWKYAFEKQWLFYHLWGRLLYDPEETDEILAKGFVKRYGEVDAGMLLEAWSLASKVPQQLASFYKGTWDFTLYSEGFLAPWNIGYDDGKSPFISVEELARHETLDQRYLSIEQYGQRVREEQSIDTALTTPVELATLLKENSDRVMELITPLRQQGEGTKSELGDLETWAYLGYYFSDKLRAAVALDTYWHEHRPEDKDKAVEYLEKCLLHWKEVIRLTEYRYKPMPYVSFGHHEPRWPKFNAFHWKLFLKDVEEDITYVRALD
ncbi:MAG: hypothetical protein OEX02_05810 [Cyclobacteriaceae bacterium]|nr:hypothetical protein [Cyclobacteriaceae bacterium]